MDYIFANGQRIAQADSYDERIHTHGTSSGTGEYASWHLPLSGSGYVVKSGDRISWRQYETGGGRGGVLLGFTDNSTANWTTYDQNGEIINSATTQDQWMERTVDLTPFAGKTMRTVGVVTDAQTGACTWDVYYSDMAIVSTDGTVTPIYDRESAVSLQYYSSAGITNAVAAAERSNTADDAEQPGNSTTYYVGDQIGSERILLAAGGWPLSADTYYPYGVEASPSSGVNHYKFTGKERDTESGNDYFLARYYSSNMGRFMSPDPDSGTLIHQLNPQRWNMYAYALNNPLTITDPTGMDAAAVNFSGMVGPFGHEGIVSINPDGSAQFGSFGPAVHDAAGLGGVGSEPGKVQTSTNLPTIQFGANGLPTDASMTALKNKLAQIEKVDPSTVRINYFKTTPQETANLNAWITQQKSLPNWYSALCIRGSRNCESFTAEGLVAGGALTQSQANKLSIIPNWMFDELQQNCHTEQTSSTFYDSNGNVVGTAQGTPHTVCN